MDQMARENSLRYLFTQPPLLPFRSERINCPVCREPLKVNKTRRKTLHTLHLGRFRVWETFLECKSCENKTIYSAEQLRALAPSGGRFGYDVMVFVGKALFLQHRRADEIIEQLLERNIPISASGLEYLGKKFVVFLALAHRQCAPALKQFMCEKGGYILHLDGTCEGSGPMLMSSLDSISQIVLGNVKVPSEKAQELIALPGANQMSLRCSFGAGPRHGRWHSGGR